MRRKNIILVSLVIVVATAGALASGSLSKGRRVPETCRDFTESHISINNQTINVAVVTSGPDQRRGLSGCPELPANSGMLFTYSQAWLPSFWMKDMLIPIDIIWVNGEEIVDITHNIQPEPGVPDANLKTYRPSQSADKVIEIAAGQAANLGIKVGDRAEFDL